MAEALYPHATHIVYACHAREHLHDLAGHLAFITPIRRNGWRTGSASTPAAGGTSYDHPARLGAI